MAIIYGIGQHFDILIRERLVPTEDISCIIDNNLAKRGMKVEGKKLYTWEGFLADQDLYKQEEYVIGSKVQFDSIKKQIVDELKTDRVIYIDDWIKKYPQKKNYIESLIEGGKTGFISGLMETIGPIKTELLKNTRVYPDRESALGSIQEGGVAVEVGVAFGDFSEKIIKNIHPEKFYAVDIFSDKTRGFFEEDDLFSKERITHEAFYRNRFKNEIEKGMVELKKGLSWDTLAKFDDDSIDYLYLDAAHDYESVKKDIEAIIPKMKNGGIIQFNDYSVQMNFGVCPAVNSFVNETDSVVDFYCLSKDGFDDIGIRINK